MKYDIVVDCLSFHGDRRTGLNQVPQSMILSLCSVGDEVVESVVVLGNARKNNLYACGNGVFFCKLVVEDVVISSETDGAW